MVKTSARSAYKKALKDTKLNEMLHADTKADESPKFPINSVLAYYVDLLKKSSFLCKKWQDIDPEDFTPSGFLPDTLEILCCSPQIYLPRSKDDQRKDLLPTPEQRPYEHLNYHSVPFQTAHMKESKRLELTESLTNILEYAIKNKIHFTIIPEMCFPGQPVVSKDDFENMKKYAGDQGKMQLDNFIEVIESCCAKQYSNTGYLISGSFHDVITHFNVSPIYRWPNIDAPLRLIQKDRLEERLPNPTLYFKMTQGIRLDELTHVDPRQWPKLYDTSYGTLSILICSDIFRSSFINSFLERSYSRKAIKPDIIMVPSCSPKYKQMWDTCLFLSTHCSSLIVLCNPTIMREKSGTPFIDIFFNGNAKSVSDFPFVRKIDITIPGKIKAIKSDLSKTRL